MNFVELGISLPIVHALSRKGYKAPTEVQCEVIPHILKGQNLIAHAQTGSGKTASFCLPILEKFSKEKQAKHNQAKSLIIVPTRELAAQILENIQDYCLNLNIRSAAVYGGVKINPQMMGLRSGVEVLVATPGRLIDLYEKNAIKFDDLSTLVIDEADKMLDMGFIDEVKTILGFLPPSRQNLLFSATMSTEIKNILSLRVENTIEVSLAPVQQTVETIEHYLHPVDKDQKMNAVMKLYRDNDEKQLIIFTKTKRKADEVVKKFTKSDIKAAAIHGDKSQSIRSKYLAGFKAGNLNVLVATDIIARGIDITDLPLVVNFDLPKVAQDYIHRVGRTGRAGKNGLAISLVSAEEFDLLKKIERLLKGLIKRTELDGIIPTEPLKESILDTRPIKAKKPKKKKK